MRIRKSASLLLGTAYSIPAAPALDVVHPFEPLKPPPISLQASCSVLESSAASSLASHVAAQEETCKLSINPWDLMNELHISDPQEDDIIDKYSVPFRASCFSTNDMSVALVKKGKRLLGIDTIGGENVSQPGHEVPKKVPKFVMSGEEIKHTNKKEVDQEKEVKQLTYKCKKNDGKGWHCRRPVSRPNSFCDYHLLQKSEAKKKKVAKPPATSKPATSFKPQKKKPRNDSVVTEGFYYYAGFGPSHNK